MHYYTSFLVQNCSSPLFLLFTITAFGPMPTQIQDVSTMIVMSSWCDLVWTGQSRDLSLGFQYQIYKGHTGFSTTATLLPLAIAKLRSVPLLKWPPMSTFIYHFKDIPANFFAKICFVHRDDKFTHMTISWVSQLVCM